LCGCRGPANPGATRDDKLPTQNAFVESFNGKFREFCLNLHWFASLEDARSTIDDWRKQYNHVRPHRSLGKLPPAIYAKRAA